MSGRFWRTVLAAFLVIAAGRGLARGGPDVAPTRDALDAARRRLAVLENEHALASTRQPYLVLDLHAKTLRYRLMGMTLREVPLPDLHVKGLIPAASGKDPEPSAVAGIFTLREKDGDPRLDPLTPEQVEAGADDENAANVLPPEPPKSYRVKFKQPVVLRVTEQSSSGAVREKWASVRDIWDRLRGASKEEKTRLALSVTLDVKTGAEVYRSLIPDLRWLVVPPPGFTLPSAGQEAPPKPKVPRPAPKPPPKPVEPPGVQFQIPAPVENGDAGETVPPPSPDQGPAGGTPPAAEPEEGATEEPLPEDDAPPPPDPDPDRPGTRPGALRSREPSASAGA